MFALLHGLLHCKRYVWLPLIVEVDAELLLNCYRLFFENGNYTESGCINKLRDEWLLSPGGLNGDSVTCLDVIMVKQLSNSACHSILFKLVMTILRHESSEALRRCEYTFFLYRCKHTCPARYSAT
ncbi:hypothetical protein GIB67_016193 [Kingdonia uniflora]|uniref:Uncharacterized protein n=1 Tax=Kingdonia uniflora TaxID=39325 RepID=A0A7J7LT79_9MAGN|nr:hypothetical protein GIB67_016193 [Kingdonia uniflora]